MKDKQFSLERHLSIKYSRVLSSTPTIEKLKGKKNREEKNVPEGVNSEISILNWIEIDQLIMEK